MIPSGAFTDVPQVSSFQPPYNQPYSALSQTVLGGAAIGDASQGRQVKNWTVAKVGSLIAVTPEGGPFAFTLSAPAALTVSLAFDTNMGVVLAWMELAGAKLYYYDTTTAGYITRTFAGATSCRVCVDDARDFYTADSDVIFAYTLSGNLYYRQQRDVYNVEYTVAPTTKLLRQVAPSVSGRLQFELR